MKVPRDKILKELKTRAGEKSVSPEQARIVFDAFIDVMSGHVKDGDTIEIGNLYIRDKSQKRKKKKPSSRSSRSRKSSGKTSKFAERFSNNIILGECIAIASDFEYFTKKTVDFLKKSIVITIVITVYYFLTVLIGC